MLTTTEHQAKTFSAAFTILEEAIAQRAFPAASIAVTHKGRLVALKAFGNFVYPRDEERSAGDPSSPRTSRESLPRGESRRGGASEVTPTTLFDIASVTKVVATTTTASLLYERGLLDLEVPLDAIVPEFLTDFRSAAGTPDLRRHEVTLRMLLAHSSGLPAYEKLFLKAPTRDQLLRAAFAVPLTADPGSRAEYSDIGFILLGVALERLAGESLDLFCQREIFGPLGMSNTTFHLSPDLRLTIPPTVDDRTFRNRVIQGEVQDENASVLGGVAGHAGLFATAEDLAKFAHAMLQGGHPILRRETVALFTKRESTPQGTSRALGWDTPSTPSQSGKHFSPNSYGHLGYTGTSLWIDPTRQLSVILLTNRTWPDCSNQAIKQVRPKFHDAVLETLEDLE